MVGCAQLFLMTGAYFFINIDRSKICVERDLADEMDNLEIYVVSVNQERDLL